MSEDGLNPKQLRFVEEYLIDGSAKNAAIRAGYSAATAASIGSKMTAHPKVRAALDSRRRDLSDRTKVDAEWVRKQLTEVLHRCLKSKPVVEWDKMRGEYVETGEWQFDSGGANKALELLGKHVGMFQADRGERRSVEDLTSEELLRLAAELRRRRDAGTLVPKGGGPRPDAAAARTEQRLVGGPPRDAE
jgi:phage terminase small subunit